MANSYCALAEMFALAASWRARHLRAQELGAGVGQRRVGQHRDLIGVVRVAGPAREPVLEVGREQHARVGGDADVARILRADEAARAAARSPAPPPPVPPALPPPVPPGRATRPACRRSLPPPPPPLAPLAGTTARAAAVPARAARGSVPVRAAGGGDGEHQHRKRAADHLGASASMIAQPSASW